MNTDLENKIGDSVRISVWESVDNLVWISTRSLFYFSAWCLVWNQVDNLVLNTNRSIHDPLEETLNEYSFKK